METCEQTLPTTKNVARTRRSPSRRLNRRRFSHMSLSGIDRQRRVLVQELSPMYLAIALNMERKPVWHKFRPRAERKRPARY